MSDLVGFARAAEGDGVETPAVKRFASLGGSQPSRRERDLHHWLGGLHGVQAPDSMHVYLRTWSAVYTRDSRT